MEASSRTNRLLGISPRPQAHWIRGHRHFVRIPFILSVKFTFPKDLCHYLFRQRLWRKPNRTLRDYHQAILAQQPGAVFKDKEIRSLALELFHLVDRFESIKVYG